MNIKESAFNMCERSGTILQNEKYIYSLEEIINTNLFYWGGDGQNKINTIIIWWGMVLEKRMQLFWQNRKELKTYVNEKNRCDFSDSIYVI